MSLGHAGRGAFSAVVVVALHRPIAATRPSPDIDRTRSVRPCPRKTKDVFARHEDVYKKEKIPIPVPSVCVRERGKTWKCLTVAERDAGGNPREDARPDTRRRDRYETDRRRYRGTRYEMFFSNIY